METEGKFVPFWFESNEASRMVNSPDDWRTHIVAAYSKGKYFAHITIGDLLMRCSHATVDTEETEEEGIPPRKNYAPNFGMRTYAEHCSALTLKEWAQKKGMFELLDVDV